MAISLCLDLNSPPLDWEEFVSSNGYYKIALDGYVRGGPKYFCFPDGPVATFNHHEDVDRLATRATCAQVLLAIREGLFSVFRKNNEPTAYVYVNDCDEDVCLSWWLINNHYLVQNTINPLINKLVCMEDFLDCTSGSYPVCMDLPFLAEMGWIFEPYRMFRASGGLRRKNQYEYLQVIESVCSRITAYVMGHGQRIQLDCKYTVLETNKGWSMVSETGAHARSALFANGIKAFVSVSEPLGDKRTYTVCKLSQFISGFDVPSILEALNFAERQKRGVNSLNGDVWGGGDIVGGSPRVSGSVLTPSEVSGVVKEVLGEND